MFLSIFQELRKPVVKLLSFIKRQKSVQNNKNLSAKTVIGKIIQKSTTKEKKNRRTTFF